MIAPRRGLPLSKTQWIVWCLVINGATRDQVAYSLGITADAAHSQVKAIKAKRGTKGSLPWAL